MRTVLSPRSRLPVARVGPLVQSAIFTLGSGIASLVAFATTAIVARSLRASEFGTLSFAASFALFVAMFFEFGLFIPAGRRIAMSGELETRRTVAAVVLAYLPVGVAYSLFLFGASYWVDALFHVDAGLTLRVVAPMAVGYPFVIVGMFLAQGAGRLHVYSATALLAQVAFLAGVIVLRAAGRLDITAAFAARSLGVVAAGIVVVVWLRPVYRGALHLIPRLLTDAKGFGFELYAGRVLSTGTYNMDALMLAAFTDARTVGYYSLAVAMASASGLPVQGLAAALFRRMANQPRIDRQWLWAATLVGATCAAIAIALSGVLVRHALSPRYASAIGLMVPLAFAQAVRGVTGIYNGFLSARAGGRELRQAAVVLTVSNLVLNFALIPPFGAMGAAYASLVALFANLIAHIVYYRRFTLTAIVSPTVAHS